LFAKILSILLLLLSGLTLIADSKKEVAFTFDDLPSAGRELAITKGINASILKQLRENSVPATGFVNEGSLYVRNEVEDRIDLLREWLDHGHELGNHTFSHIAIDRNPVEAYMEDVIRGETITRWILDEKGKTLRYFRHTQLRTGPSEDYKKQLDEFLSERGYTVAPVTIDNQEWVYAGAYRKATDPQVRKKIGEQYLQHMAAVLDFFAKLSKDTLGYEVKHILLLHANEINADYLQALIDLFRKEGYEFISLEEALKDPAYLLSTPVSARGLSWIHRWRMIKGMEMVEEPRESEEIRKLAF
jgi:peptidoglycan/xylan/chitin deacetylase (PgdA/CDA1 family)